MGTRGTPWGFADEVREVAPGIESVSTASHGGFLLSPERWAEFQAMFPDFQPFAGERCLEEDCDAVLAVLVWPQFFSEDARAQALDMARRCHDYFRTPAEWWESAHGMKLAEEAAAYKLSIAARWRVTGLASGQSRSWEVWLRRVGDDTQRTVAFASYPTQGLYTDEELAAQEAGSR